MRACIVIVWVAVTAVVAAQDAARFEVASIRESTRTQPAPQPSSPDRLVRVGFTLLQLVQGAFERDQFTVAGGPAWVNSARFDVIAKSERPVTGPEMRAMTRRLLEERFALRTHTEMRELDAFALVLARQDGRLGPQLKPSAFDCRPFLAGVRPMSESPANDRGISQCMIVGGVFGRLGTGFSHRGRGLDSLTPRLQGVLGRPVVDRTGLTGAFDVDLRYRPDTQAPVPDSYPPLTAALEEQLGLKLESGKETIDVLVIDDAQPPTPN